MKILKKITSFVLMFMMVVTMSGVLGLAKAQAASVTSFSALLERERASTASNQTITFTTPTGIAAAATLILTYNNATSTTGVVFTDIDIADDGVDAAIVAGAPAGASWGFVNTSSTVLTFTNGSAAVVAGSVIVIEIGTHATFGVTGTNKITNGSAGTSTLVLSGTFGDSGTAAMPIIADDRVVITATVAPTITFSLSANTIAFGTLTAGAARYADTSTGSGSNVVAHTMAVATNAAGGYAITYNGATLTSGANTIDVATITSDADGTPGTEQFGLSISTAGAGTIASGYNQSGPDWKWVASTTTGLISRATPTSATETISARYLANISGSTEAGAYSTAVTYIATGTF